MEHTRTTSVSRNRPNKWIISVKGIISSWCSRIHRSGSVLGSTEAFFQIAEERTSTRTSSVAICNVNIYYKHIVKERFDNNFKKIPSSFELSDDAILPINGVYWDSE
jgi:hypothetical protein